MTIVVCMNATGYFVPSYFIFLRENMSAQLMRGCLPGSEGVAHLSSWIQMNIFTDWFRHFTKHTNPAADLKVLLSFDGHYNHTRNINLIELAREHNVEIIFIPYS